MSIPHDKLLDYQRGPTEHLLGVLARRRAALDGSDTGVGKTYTAAAICAALKRPTLAVVPKIAATSWRRAAEHVGTELDVFGWEKLRAGNTPFGWWDNPLTKDTPRRFQCRWCQLVNPDDKECRVNPVDGHDLVKIATRHNYGKFHWAPEVEFIIFDEIQRANGKGLNCEMLCAAKRQNKIILGLSATPAVTPLHFRALGYMLDMHTLNGPAGFLPWSRHYGCRLHPQFRGWVWMVSKDAQEKHMRQLNQLIFPERGIRIRKDAIPGFPKVHIQADLLDLEKCDKIDWLYEHLDTVTEAEEDEIALVKLLRVRQKIELLKVPLMLELRRDYLDKGYAVAMFVNFSETLAAIRKKLKLDYYIDGTQRTEAERQPHLDAFQSNETRDIVVNSAAGGVACGLHDIRGEFPCVGLVMPPLSPVSFRQLVGRLNRSGGKSDSIYRVLFAAGTKEVDMHRKLSQKLNNLDRLMDSDLVPDNLSFHYAN